MSSVSIGVVPVWTRAIRHRFFAWDSVVWVPMLSNRIARSKGMLRDVMIGLWGRSAKRVS